MSNPLRWFDRGTRWRELRLIGLCIAIGLVLMPMLLAWAGDRWLGAYAPLAGNESSGTWALWKDYLRSILGARVPYWLVFLGPYLALVLWRLLRWGWRRLSQQPGSGDLSEP